MHAGIGSSDTARSNSPTIRATYSGVDCRWRSPMRCDFPHRGARSRRRTLIAVGPGLAAANSGPRNGCGREGFELEFGSGADDRVPARDASWARARVCLPMGSLMAIEVVAPQAWKDRERPQRDSSTRRDRAAGIDWTDVLPQSDRGSGDLDGVRGSEIQHAIEDIDGHLHFGRPAFAGVRTQGVTDHPLEPRHGYLGPGTPDAAGRRLPNHAAIRSLIGRNGMASPMRITLTPFETRLTA